MKYTRINNSLEETYSITSFNVDHFFKTVNVSLIHAFFQNGSLVTELLNDSLNDSTYGYAIDPKFEMTPESINELMKDDPLFDEKNPLSWMRVQNKIPKIEIPENKFYTRISAAANIENEILNCLIKKGTLPSGNEWSIK